jgi:tetratricopeptide (TPR) repeat protein
MVEAHTKLVEIERLRLGGQTGRARRLCEDLVAAYPNYVGALHTLGLLLADGHQHTQALTYLVRATMLNPKNWKTLTALSGVYLRLGCHEMAAQTLEQALLLKPDDVAVLLTLGEIYKEEREYALAARVFRKTCTLDPSLFDAGMGLGVCLVHMGQFAEAAEVYQDLIQRGSHSIKTLYALTQLPANLVELDILALVDHAIPDGKQEQADFECSQALTRGAALDKSGRHVEAWEQLVAANRWLRSRYGNAWQTESRRHEGSLARARAATTLTRTDAEGIKPAPISLFILGASRAGKTMFEQLVGQISGVKRGFENIALENAVRRTFQSAGLLTSHHISLLPMGLNKAFEEHYSDEMKIRAPGAQLFTNTHPETVHDVIRLAEALPSARFVFVKRDPDDIALRIFMRRYQEGNNYAYDIGTIRQHVAWYDEMIDVLGEKLPGVSRTIRYEGMVSDPEAALGVAAKLCGLELPRGLPLSLGDDRGCAKPYRAMMVAMDGRAE